MRGFSLFLEGNQIAKLRFFLPLEMAQVWQYDEFIRIILYETNINRKVPGDIFRYQNGGIVCLIGENDVNYVLSYMAVVFRRISEYGGQPIIYNCLKKLQKALPRMPLIVDIANYARKSDHKEPANFVNAIMQNPFTTDPTDFLMLADWLEEGHDQDLKVEADHLAGQIRSTF